MKKKVAKLLCVILSILLVLGLFFSAEIDLKIANNRYLFVLSTLYMSLITYFLGFNFVIRTVTKKKALGFVFGTMLLSVVLSIALPFRYKDMVQENRMETIKSNINSLQCIPLIANEKALGNQVIIEKIKLNGKEIKLNDVNLSQGWQIVDGKIYTDSIGAKPLIINTDKADNYEISVRENSTSAKIKIKMDNYEKDFDLYNATDDVVVSLDLDSLVPKELLKTHIGEKCIIYYICYYILIYILVSIVVQFLYLKKKA